MEKYGGKQKRVHRRVVWRGTTVFAAEPGSAIAALLAQYAEDHPEQVRTLTDEEMQELAEAPELPPTPVPITWDRSLRQIRRARDISQRKLSEMAGVGVKSIIRCDLGDWKPTHKTIERISEALGLHPDEIREFARVRWAEAERMGLDAPLPLTTTREASAGDKEVS
jgi:DNA-binding XRE family transcriptional regulator